MLNNKVYQDIFTEIEVFLPAKWDKVVIYLEYGSASYTFLFYVDIAGKYVNCFDIDGIDEDRLMNSFARIDEMVSAERQKYTGELWSNMTMMIDNKGKMRTDFDYTDLSDGLFKYRKIWKLKYLR